ncbi:Uncharacterised protein [Serratia entomophila]|nr:Uncharacterised protein [Serratia entomophila]CAI1836406.1 Uncharacterised protein [Serratia entomophila]
MVWTMTSHNGTFTVIGNAIFYFDKGYQPIFGKKKMIY